VPITSIKLCTHPELHHRGDCARKIVHSEHKIQFVLIAVLQGQSLHPPLHPEGGYEINRWPNFFPQQMANPDSCWPNASGCTNAPPVLRACYKLLTPSGAWQQKTSNRQRGRDEPCNDRQLWNISMSNAGKKIPRAPKTLSLLLVPRVS